MKTLINRRRLVTWALVVSLGLNLFLVSMWIGRQTWQATADSQTKRSIQAMLASLPSASQDLVRSEIALALPRVHQHFASLHLARTELAEEIEKAATDRAALERRFGEVQRHTNAIGLELQQAMSRALPQLNQEDRKAILKALAQQSSRGALPLP